MRRAVPCAFVCAIALTGCGGSSHSASSSTSHGPNRPQNCTRTFSPRDIGTDPSPGSNVETAFQHQVGPATFCFSAGVYGDIDLYAAHPTGVVTLTPIRGAAVAMGHIQGDGVSNLAVTGFSGQSSSGGLGLIVSGHGPNSNVTFSENAMSTTGVSILDNPIPNANIRISHNEFVGFKSSIEQARLNVARDTGCPDGIVVSFNLMQGGQSDGIDVGGADCGTQVLHNVLRDIGPDSCGGIHCDAFQDNGGSRHDVVAYNYIEAGDCFLMDDGSMDLGIHDNVCVGTGAYMVQYGGAVGLTIDHNTFATFTGSSMGTWGRDHSVEHCVASSGVTLTNNVLGAGLPSLNSTDECGAGPPEGTYAREDYNLIKGGGGAGAHDITGTASFVGGASPGAWPQFKLAAGSPGIGNASDGTNRGVSSFLPPPGP